MKTNSKSLQSATVLKVINKVVLYVVLVLLAIPILWPFWWMFTSAFKKTYEIFAFPPTLLPTQWNWQNFADAFTYQPFAQHYINSLYIAILVTLGTAHLFFSGGYAFARIRFGKFHHIPALALSVDDAA